MLEEKVYRGTWSEIASHQGELPPDAILEMRIISASSEHEDRSLYDRFGHLFGVVHGGPADVAELPETYMQGFGETKNLRDQP